MCINPRDLFRSPQPSKMGYGDSSSRWRTPPRGYHRLISSYQSPLQNLFFKDTENLSPLPPSFCCYCWCISPFQHLYGRFGLVVLAVSLVSLSSPCIGTIIARSVYCPLLWYLVFLCLSLFLCVSRSQSCRRVVALDSTMCALDVLFSGPLDKIFHTKKLLNPEAHHSRT